MRTWTKRTFFAAIVSVGALSSTSAQILPTAGTLASQLHTIEALPSQLRGAAIEAANGLVDEGALTNAISELNLGDQSIRNALGKVDELSANLGNLSHMLDAYSNLTPELDNLQRSVESALANTKRAQSTLSQVLESSINLGDGIMSGDLASATEFEAKKIVEAIPLNQYGEGPAANIFDLMQGLPHFEALKTLDLDLSWESLLNLNLLSIASLTKRFTLDLSVLKSAGISKENVRKAIESGFNLASELRISYEWLKDEDRVNLAALAENVDSIVGNLTQVSDVLEVMESNVREMGQNISSLDLEDEFTPVVEQATSSLMDLPVFQALEATDLLEQLGITGETVREFNDAARNVLDLTQISDALSEFSFDTWPAVPEIAADFVAPLENLEMPTAATGQFVQDALAASTDTISGIQDDVTEYLDGMQQADQSIVDMAGDSMAELQFNMGDASFKAVKTATGNLAAYLKERGIAVDQNRLADIGEQIAAVLNAGDNPVKHLLETKVLTDAFQA